MLLFSEKYVEELFVSLGIGREYASIVANVLVKAVLMDISSHGVQRARRYIDSFRPSNIEPNNESVIMSEVGAVAVIDAKKGFGQVAGVEAIELSVEKAGIYGVSVVAVRNSNLFGIAGYYPLRAVKKGYIGIAATNSRPLVAYTHTMDKTPVQTL